MIHSIFITSLLYNIGIISAWEEGVATYYTGLGDPNPGEGNACGNPEPPYHFAATGGDLWNWAYQCGACYQIRCIDSAEGGDCGCVSTDPVTVQIINQCDECRSGGENPDFDLRIETRNAISNCGRTKIEYERVDCSHSGGIMIQNKASGLGWVGMYIYNVAGRGALNGVKLKSKSGSYWYVCEIRDQNYWFCGEGLMDDFPYTIIFIDDENTEVWGWDRIWAFDGTIDTGVQFQV